MGFLGPGRTKTSNGSGAFSDGSSSAGTAKAMSSLQIFRSISLVRTWFLLRKYGGDRESILEMSAYVTDVVSDHAEHLRVLFDRFSARLIRELGDPDELIMSEKVEWSTSSSIIGLVLDAMGIDPEIVNPRYRKWDADCEWYDDRAEVDPTDE